MNIIFGESINQWSDRYTILELDQLRLPPEGRVVTSYCVVEYIPLDEMPTADVYRQLHQDCVMAYRQRHWDVCEQALAALRGKWGGELDSFYQHLSQRVQTLKNQSLPQDWTGVIDKTLVSSQ